MIDLDWLAAREAVNLGLLVADLCVIFILVRVILAEMKVAGWLNYAYNQAAVAFLIYISGHAVVRGWGQILLYSIRRHQDPTAAENTYHIAFIANLVVLTGLLAIVRVFTPKGENWVWGSIFILTGIVGILDYMFPYTFFLS